MKYLLIAAAVLAGVFFFNRSGSSAEISYEELQRLLQNGSPVTLLDVRTRQEYDGGHIPGALLLPYDEVEQQAAALLPDKSREIVVYCRSGRRSAIAAETLGRLGYEKVSDFGAVSRWKGELEK